jgi:hypothetical protein
LIFDTIVGGGGLGWVRTRQPALGSESE